MIGAEVLKMLVPDSVKWTIYGDDYSGIIWHDQQQTEPTEEEIAQAWIDYQAKVETDLAAEQAKKAAAEAKLVALGLTAEDLKALGL